VYKRFYFSGQPFKKWVLINSTIDNIDEQYAARLISLIRELASALSSLRENGKRSGKENEIGRVWVSYG
jgi:hypothetical protein